MASGYFYGNTVQSTWRAYGLWETTESETAMTIKLHGGFQSVGWGFDVADVTCTVTNNGTAKSGTKNVSTGTGSTENVRIVSDNNKTINKTHADQTITLKVYIDRTGGYKGGTSQKTTTITVPKKKSWTVSYNLNGGSGTAPSSQTKWYGETLKLSTATPSRTGYTFKGWATSASGSVAYASGANYTSNAGATLYAVWQINTYAVSYNANKPSGASGSVSNLPTNQTKTYGQALPLSSTKPTLAEYSFTGWNTAANGSGTAYSSGGSYTGNAALTLYAQWVRAYDLPTISDLVVIRCTLDDTDPNNPVYTDDEEGESMRVAFDWEVDTTHGSHDGVATVVSIQWKQKTETTWTTMDITPSPAESSGSEIVYVQYYAIPAAPDEPVPFDKDLAYDVKITVTDNHGMTTTVQTLLSTTVYVFDVAANGLGLAIGKPIAPDATGLKVAWDTTFDDYVHFGNHVYFPNAKGIFGKNPDGDVVTSFEPCNSGGGTIIGYGLYALEKGYTNIYGTDVNITSRNTVDINNNVLLDNSKYYQIKNSSGSAWNAVTLNNSNQYTFGNGGYSASTGESFFDGNWVRIRTKNKVTINGKAPFKYTTNSVAIGNVSAGSGWTKNKQATAQSGYTAVGIIGFNQTHNQAGSVGGCLINVSNRTCYAYGSNWGGNWTGTNNFQWDILWIANELL